MPKLGVNIDHVATVRQARGGVEPDPVWAAAQVELAGADGIVVHLREDRRHIQDRDLAILKKIVQSKLNLEMAINEDVMRIAIDTRPDQATLVPERREELTTEGGLDVAGQLVRVSEASKRLQAAGIVVSLFIDPEPEQLAAAKKSGAEAIELHTGRYADAGTAEEVEKAFAALARAAEQAKELGLVCHAGHGLNYLNVGRVAALPNVEELNIGHSIIGRAIFLGLRRAVHEMKRLIEKAAAGN
ncbi:MAG: pyridoxine 5'-phosphate synthase [Phycisphaerae bacterium]|jgi:pyridoxine 5-phosphate synthase|nr:pyridoxine 5'-phosphate synthase [Phycisphaerae bacterium]